MINDKAVKTLRISKGKYNMKKNLYDQKRLISILTDNLIKNYFMIVNYCKKIR